MRGGEAASRRAGGESIVGPKHTGEEEEPTSAAPIRAAAEVEEEWVVSRLIAIAAASC